MAPRLRDDLVAATVEEDGVVYVDLTDPATGVNFRFYDFEYELAKQLTGQPVEDVVAWASATYQLELTDAALDEFVEKLAGLGFLVGAGAGAQPTEISPLSPSSGSAPFSAPIALAEEPERVELASAPMFGEGSAGLVVPPEPPAVAAVVEPPRRSSPPSPSPPPLGAPAVASIVAGALTDGGAVELRFREASSSNAPGRSRTLPGINLAPLTPMTSSSSAAEGNAPAPVLPRLQSLGSPLPPLAGEAVLGGSEIKRAPPRPHAAGAPAPVAPIAPFPLAATPPPHFARPLPPSLPAGSAASARSMTPAPAPAPAVSSPLAHPVAPTPKLTPKSPSSSPPAADETPFVSIAYAIVSEADLAPGFPPPASPGALEPSAGGSLASAVAAVAAAAPPPSAASPSSAPPPSAPPPSSALAIPSGLAPSPFAASPALVGGGAGSSGPAPTTGDKSPSRAGAAWASALTDAVERPFVERRQPPGPEVVVMPPVEPAALAPVPKRRAPLVVGAVMFAGIAAAAVYALRDPPHDLPPPSATAPSVHVAIPQPTTIYEWFGTTGIVIAGHDDELGFKVAGKLQDVMPPGTTFSAGEAVAHLQGASVRELNVNRIRSRVAFFEQLRDSSRAAGNEAAARQAEANVAARKRELGDAQAKLAELEIRPAIAGTIGQVLMDRGALVKAGVPVFRIRAAGPRATFALGADDQARARAVGFCRVETLPPAGAAAAEVAGAGAAAAEKLVRSLDCSLLAPAAAGGAAEPAAPLAVDLPAASGVALGTAVRLASARFDGVFPIPRSAIVHEAAGQPGGDRVWVVSAATQGAESRTVELAASSPADPALVSRGLSTGDAVIVDPPADLASGVKVNVVR